MNDKIQMNAERENIANKRAVSSGIRDWARLAVAWAWLLLLVGCCLSLITVAHGVYAQVLLAAIWCAGVATLLLMFGILRGGVGTRVLAFLGIGPLLFIVSELLSRASCASSRGIGPLLFIVSELISARPSTRAPGIGPLLFIVSEFVRRY